MLRFLRVRDFALIHELEIEFGPGLNLLTGETGSGKSIVVDALGLLAGRRFSSEMIRSGCETAALEGTFSMQPDGPAAQLLKDAGIGLEEDQVIIRRELSAGGRSRVFINDSLAALATLKAVGDTLTDIHSQQEQQSLLDVSAHLDWLDRFGKNQEMVAPVRASYRKMSEIGRRLESMRIDEQERLRRMDILEFQLNEIRNAKLRPEEKQELESEKNILANREKIFALANEAYTLLYEHESSLITQIRRVHKILEELNGFDASWGAHRDAASESMYRLEDLALTMRDYTGNLDFSPDRLDQVEQRLSEIEKLSRKYGHLIEEIISYSNKTEVELELLRSHADTSRLLTSELQKEIQEYHSLAEKLSGKRRRDATRLEKEIRDEFAALAMENMELSVRFDPDQRPTRISLIPSHYGPAGVDRVEFLLAPNKGEEMKPLARIVSGGELSRVMLAVKSLCGGDEYSKSLVFDEVDSGIGGRVAEAVGKRLKRISEKNQVLCVTHLPQIAAFATRHYHVSKETVGERTETSVRELDATGRIFELARMLGGEVITEITRRHAREMLNTAEGKQDKPGRAQE
jgi:DNA repair protein RecN (Recombination protein N)